MALIIINGPFIQAGESLSDAVDCSAGRLVKITMPGQWNSAEITFQTSSDGIMYNDIRKPDGSHLQCIVFPGSAILGIDLTIGWLKIRSGTPDHPVVQNGTREFAVAILPFAP